MSGSEEIYGVRLEKILDSLPAPIREEALTHVSYANENPPKPQNERLEFLGDAVLDLTVAHLLFLKYPAAKEGDLTRMRAHLVKGALLSSIASELGLGEYLYLGKGEIASGGREKPRILAGALEAVIGAVFLSGGWEKAKKLSDALFSEKTLNETPIDSKTKLQEYVQGEALGSLSYEILEVKGPPHRPMYRISCVLGPETLSIGEGNSKKEAEEDAAGKALAHFKDMRDSAHHDFRGE